MRTGTASFRRASFRGTFLCGLVSACLFAGAAQAEIIPVDLDGTVGVSADGTEVAGTSLSNGSNRAFRWTQSGGAVDLGYLGSVAATSFARGISSNGRVVVGSSMNNSGKLEPFRWNETDGMAGLGFLPNGDYAQAYGVSHDGGVVVGTSQVSNVPRAFRWTSSGMTDLGTMAGGTGADARAVSDDGIVVVGAGNSSSFGREAFRWTAIGGMNGLGVLPGDTPHYSNTQSYATGVAFVPAVPTVSDAYIVVVGDRVLYDEIVGIETQAFRWSGATDMVGLGFLPGDTSSRALGVSADGRVVVGQSYGDSGEHAFRWTAATGMQSVADWLAEAGISTAEWQYLEKATATNSDGSVVVGNGRRFSPGAGQGWLANLSPPPPDTTPDGFSFVDQPGVARSAEITSAAVTITGINTAAVISVSGAIGGGYSIGCTATFTSSDGNISNGQTVCVRHTSSASFSTATNTTLTVGGVADTFTSITQAQDLQPGPFIFTDVSDVPLNSVQTSNSVTISGINDPAPISVSGGEYSIGCNTNFTSADGTISNTQTVCVRHTSSLIYGTATNTALTVGGGSDTFTSITAAAPPSGGGGGGGGSLPSLTLLMLTLMTGLGRWLRGFAQPPVSLFATGAGALTSALPMPEFAEENQAEAEAVASLTLVSDDARFRLALQAAVSGSRHISLDAVHLSAAALRASGALPANRHCLIDIGLPDINGIELLRELKSRNPSLRAAVMMAGEVPHTALVAICSGAEGLIEKDAPAAALVSSLARFVSGEAWFSPRCAARLLELADRPGLALPLSLLQRRVLRALCRDHHRREEEVAQGLDLKLELVRACLRDIRELLRTPATAQRVIAALRSGGSRLGKAA